MAGIILENIHIKNIKQFPEVNINFNRKFNFIAGPNGCGKTSILACISYCFIFANIEYARINKDAELWADIEQKEEKYRIGVGKGSFKATGYRESGITSWNQPPSENGRKSIVLHQVGSILKSTPLFIGAQRGIKYKQIQGLTREATYEQMIQQYLQQNIRALYGDTSSEVKQWFINRYFMIDKDWAKEEKENWNLMLEGIKKIAPIGSDFKYVRTERDLEPIFSIFGKECYLEELSAGFQAILIIIANIIEWIEGSNEAGKRSINSAVGLVAIDELDVHLHPEWQFILRKNLIELFPNIQFIVTTHSPHLLSTAEENEIIILPQSYEDTIYNISPMTKTLSGWNTDQILSDIMGVTSIDNKEYAKLIKQAYFYIERKDVSSLREILYTIEKVCNPNDPIYTVLVARLAALEA